MSPQSWARQKSRKEAVGAHAEAGPEALFEA